MRAILIILPRPLVSWKRIRERWRCSGLSQTNIVLMVYFGKALQFHYSDRKSLFYAFNLALHYLKALTRGELGHPITPQMRP